MQQMTRMKPAEKQNTYAIVLRIKAPTATQNTIHAALSALRGRLVSLALRSSFTTRCASARSASHWRAYI
jgi:hypothetical protein